MIIDGLRLVLGLLEDFGYLPRLAVLLDTMMHKMGLHGWAIIPSLLGLGCNVPGVLATRILESRRERFIAATIISIGVPCASLQAMIWGLLGQRGVGYVLVVYVTFLMAWAGTGQLTVAVMVLAMFFPCVATFVVLWKELGWMDLVRSVLVMFICSLMAGTVLNMIF